MELSSSSAAVLTRPRLAILTAAAAISVGIYFFQESLTTDTRTSTHGGGLHRSNAVRRRRRSQGDAHAEARRGSNASDSSIIDSHADENLDVTGEPAQALPDGETVVNEDANGDGGDWWTAEPPQRAGQNIVSLLFRVSEDNARRNAYVHRGCMCNACGIVPIRGIRYRCANCADFDLCETCESQGLHIKTHIFYKVKIPAPPFGPRQMQPVWYPGDPDTCLRNLPRGLMSKLSRETGFERPELEAFWEQWTYIANTEWREDPDDLCLAMDRKTFERCLVPSGGHRHTAPNLIHDRMFAFYDTNNDDLIGFSEFLHGLSYRKRKDKLHRIFDGYDVDKDGYISRRDFLRIFRAYYVLYKQMHKDILEGLDDQVMNSTEAHQLVTSRQPLSSLFGREGRVPQADHDRPIEGKLFHSNGDVVVTDDRNSVVNGDKADTGERQAVLSNLFSHRGSRSLFVESAFSPTSDHPQSPNEFARNYFGALLSPPARVDELPSLLIGETREPDGLFVDNDEDRQENGEDSDESDSSNADDDVEAEELDGSGAAQPGMAGGSDELNDRPQRRPVLVSPTTRQGAADMRWRGESINAIESRANHHMMGGPMPRTSLDRVSSTAARKKLHERWKRRQFYLDEEEGALAPEGWEQAEDVLPGMNGLAESSKSAQTHPLSPRSRSSSKVRFAEDTDDYEIRSNPSTSSRSVPERWGGMDIPDAERDAGKEILYQVTQQAFNELLDVMFKEKEDLAIRAAETKEDRDIHRHLFEPIDLDEEDRKAKSQESQAWVEEAETEPEPAGSNEDRLPQARPLEELLTETGYTVEGSLPNGVSGGHEDNLTDLEAIGSILEEARNVEEANNGQEGLSEAEAEEGTPEEKVVPYRDPTMPQFRPNSLADMENGQPFSVTVPVMSDSESGFSTADTPPSSADNEKGKSTTKKIRKDHTKTKPSLEPVAHSTLVEWKRLDVAEEEARVRGGWGRLSYDEFEEIYQREETGSNRLDYLGTWIDFCIP